MIFRQLTVRFRGRGDYYDIFCVSINTEESIHGPADSTVRLSGITRRHSFGASAAGLGTAALASLLPEGGKGAEPTSAVGGLPGSPNFAPKAKRAIYLFMSEGPSQMDLFDYKPADGRLV